MPRIFSRCSADSPFTPCVKKYKASSVSSAVATSSFISIAGCTSLVQGEACRGLPKGRDVLEPFVFEQRRVVLYEEREFCLLILRVGERERRCPDGLRMVGVLGERGDRGVGFVVDVGVFGE